VPVPERWSSPLVLTAYCGLQIGRGEAELVGEEGMPCEECLISAPPENPVSRAQEPVIALD
jgi:hypothetical protein